jgi:hypothetical protein
MRSYRVHKASPLGAEPVPSVDIAIDRELPDDPKDIDSSKLRTEVFRADARAIHQALAASLPQGTRYELLMLMLEAAPVLYRGPKPDVGSTIRAYRRPSTVDVAKAIGSLTSELGERAVSEVLGTTVGTIRAINEGLDVDRVTALGLTVALEILRRAGATEGAGS